MNALFDFVKSLPFLEIKKTDEKRGLVVFKCPICHEGKSWKTKARGYFVSTPSGRGVFGCHNCGEKWSVEDFCEIVGIEPPFKGEDASAFSIEISEAVSLEKEMMEAARELVDKPDGTSPFNFPSIFSSQKALEYVRSRGIKERAYAGWFHRNGNPVFPLTGENGVLFGFQEKVLDGSFPAKYKTIIFHGFRGVYKKVYGYYGKRFPIESRVYLTEGIFDAASIVSLGGYAVAMLGSSIAFEIVESLGERAVLIPDHDESGERSAEKLIKRFPWLQVMEYSDEYKDFNDFYVAEPEKAAAALRAE